MSVLDGTDWHAHHGNKPSMNGGVMSPMGLPLQNYAICPDNTIDSEQFSGSQRADML